MDYSTQFLAHSQRMRIMELERTEDCLDSPERYRASSGMHFIRSRLARALVNQSVKNLYTRQRRIEPQGTILIDASGSMGASTRRLQALCQAIPGASVAYYYGDSDAPGAGGQLVIYAHGGRRFKGDLPHHEGGNAVDCPAMRWLLDQPGPHTLISDLQFCGGPDAEIAIAHQLVAIGQRRGTLTVCQSLTEAFAAYGAKDPNSPITPEGGINDER